MHDELEELADEFLALVLRNESAGIEHFLSARPRLSEEARRRLRVMASVIAPGTDAAPLQAKSQADSASVSAESIGSLGHYRLLSELGRGGQSVVYLALDTRLTRRVALKVLHRTDLTDLANPSPSGPAARLRREAEIASKLDHQSICIVHDIGEEHGRLFLAMRYVEGETLAVKVSRARDARLAFAAIDSKGSTSSPSDFAYSSESVQEANAPNRRQAMMRTVRLLESCARALHFAHAAGVVHRDIKPANIMVALNHEPVILDFGLARDRENDAQLTATGEVLGSPTYMSPEQVGHSGEELDARTDVYSLGVVLYECLTLHRPFEHRTRAGLYHKILTEPPPDARRWNPDIGRDLAVVIATAMEKDRGRRYSSALAFAEDLRRVREFEPILARPAGALLRARRWIRRKPALTTVMLAMTTAIGALLYAGIENSRSDSLRRTSDQVDAWTKESYAILQKGPHDLERLAALVASLSQSQQRQAELRELKETLAFLQVVQRAEAELERANALIDQANVLNPSDPGAQQLADGMYLGALDAINDATLDRPWSNAMNAAFGKAFDFRSNWIRRTLVERSSSSTGAASESSSVGAEIIVDGTPSGADVYLFRYELQSSLEPSGEQREVPVPVRILPRQLRDGKEVCAATERVDVPIRPGATVLRVDAVAPGSVADRSGLRRGDFVIEVAGFPPVDRILVLPQVSRASSDSHTQSFATARTLQGRALLGESDLDLVRAQTQVGETLLCEVTGGVPDSAPIETVRVRRTIYGFDPVLGCARCALQTELPSQGVDIVVNSGALVRSVHLAGPGASGLTLTWTSNPLILVEANRVGTVPMTEHALAPGSYMLLIRKPGFEDLRLPITLAAGRTTTLRADLLVEGSTPPGFVFVAAGPFVAGWEHADTSVGTFVPATRETRWLGDYWIGRNQVTVAEYLEFLNDSLSDPESRQVIEEGRRTGTYLRVPRKPFIDRVTRSTCIPYWEERDGRFSTDWDPERPITDITCEDADAYCRWRTERARQRAQNWIFRLPTENEWEKAARGADGRAAPWGNQLAGGLSSWENAMNRLAAPGSDSGAPTCEPVSRFTRDESPFGVFRTAGSVLEWCAGEPYTGIPFRRPWRGGFERHDDVLLARRGDGNPDRPSLRDGFRLVAWRRTQGH